jgi:hypothetical protein
LQVNLFLTGKATSNVFDNVKEIGSGTGSGSGSGTGSVVLKGISEQSDIGFLTLYEHFNQLEVWKSRILIGKMPFLVLKNYQKCYKNAEKWHFWVLYFYCAISLTLNFTNLYIKRSQNRKKSPFFIINTNKTKK